MTDPDNNESRDVPIVVLCGGAGTRLRGSIDGPKVLAPIGGRPYLHFLLRWLVREHISSIVLATGYLGDAVADFVASELDDLHRYSQEVWSRNGVDLSRIDVQCVRESRALGTGGAVTNAITRCDLEGDFFCLNGDTLFTGEPSRLVYEGDPDAAAVVAIVEVEDTSRYGLIELENGSSQIRHFREKLGSQAGPTIERGWINAGLYLLRAERFESVQPGEFVSLERDLFPTWLQNKVCAVKYDNVHFLDIGTPADYDRALEYFVEAGWSTRK